MKRARAMVLLAGLTAVLAAVWAGRAARERTAWTGARPPRPELAAWPEALRARVKALDGRVAAGRDVAALGELARLYHANGFVREAEQAYRGLLDFEATNARWPHLLASLLAGYGKLDAAIPLLERAVRLAPDYLPARLRLGDALLKTDALPRATAAYEDVLVRAPENPYALVGLARIDLAQGRWTAAREKLTRAVRAEPWFFAGQSLLASVYERLGNEEGAAVARARASQARRFREAPDPWVEEVTTFCYDVYRLQVAAATAKATGEPRQAVTWLERARELAPDDAQTHRQLAACWVELHEWPRARAALEKSVALEPNHAAGHIELANVVLALGSQAEALLVLEAGLAQAGEQGAIHHQLGVLLRAMARDTEALPHFREAFRLNPEKPDVARDLVMALHGLGEKVAAAEALETALERHPGYAPILVLGARQRMAAGEVEGTAEMLRRAQAAGAAPQEVTELSADFRTKFGRDP